MNEFVIGGPGAMVGFIECMEFEESWPETELLVKNFTASQNACCNDHKRPTGILAHQLYREIVDSKLEDLGPKFLARAKEKGFESIRFIVDQNAYYHKSEKRRSVTYEKVLQ
jgi:hypothetical protein|tara:strand:+ start:1356 stop:1691 length:336 start_codon:yes stop_codon:yes gene_type:complete